MAASPTHKSSRKIWQRRGLAKVIRSFARSRQGTEKLQWPLVLCRSKSYQLRSTRKLIENSTNWFRILYSTQMRSEWTNSQFTLSVQESAKASSLGSRTASGESL